MFLGTRRIADFPARGTVISAQVDSTNSIVYDTTMLVPRIVLDTNVLVAALWSRRGVSFTLLSLIDSGRFEVHVSVPLVLEYEEVLQRYRLAIGFTEQDIRDLLDYICQVAMHHRVHFLWRPLLKDVKDDMLLELAVVANCDHIVTYNRRDFSGVEAFGLQVILPADLLRLIGALT